MILCLCHKSINIISAVDGLNLLENILEDWGTKASPILISAYQLIIYSHPPPPVENPAYATAYTTDKINYNLYN